VDFAYTLSGFVVGLIIGLTGVGGGSLMTPLLVMVFGVSPVNAVGTDLLYASLTKTAGAWMHTLRGNVDWTLVARLAVGSIPAALVTTGILYWIGPGHGYANALVTWSLGVALILTALSLLLRQRIQQWAIRSGQDAWRAKHEVTLTVLVGLILGVLVTISSVGAGALGVAALFWLRPNMPGTRIVGSDIAHAVPLTGVAGLGHIFLGTVDFKLLLALMIGSLPGIYLGSRLCARIPERFLRVALASMLVLIGGRLVF
jgi:uncharacterized membrane protein YfcA